MTLDTKYTEMTQTPVRRLVLRLAVPTILGMMVTSLYNVVDAAFVGHLSTEATAGIGIAFAYQAFLQAMGFFFGHGSGNYMSRSLGAKRYDDASHMAAVGFFSPFMLGVIAAIVFTPILPQLSVWLGATSDVVPSTVAYLRYIVIATPFMMTTFTINNQLRLQGNAKLGMVGIMSGALLNIGLDALFIYGFDMGVTGASLATCISQVCGWCLLVWGTTRPASVHIEFKYFKPRLNDYYEIMMGGLPSLCRQAFNCISAICLNYAAARYALPGTEASVVASFAIVSRTMMFAFSVVLGLDQGFQPVAGFNYGAKNYARVRQSYIFATQTTTMVLIAIATAGYLLAPDIIRIFRAEDPELIANGTRILRYQCLSFPLIGIPTATNMLFQVIRMPIRSTLISIGRQGLFFIPAVYILPKLWGIEGVMLVQPIADVLTFLLAIPFAIWISRKLKAA